MRALRRDTPTTVGAVIVALSVLLAIAGPALAPYDPERATGDVLLAPSAAHLFGTDASGIDVFSRVIAAFRADVFIALVAVAISSVGGVVLGALTGYGFRTRWSRAGSWTILRLGDVVQALPVFILALALVGMTGPSVRNVVIAIAFVNLPIFLRLTRGAVLVTQRDAYVDAARAMGLPSRRILLRHVVPNSLEPVLANASVTVGFAVLLTAALSFLGAGVRAPTPEWGAAIAAGSKNLVTGEWWISVLPGIVLSTVVLGFALLGDGLRRAWDPAGRQTIDPRTEAR